MNKLTDTLKSVFSKEDPDKQAREAEIVDVLKTIFDPEIPVNIYDLGLIYKIEIKADNHIHIDMTLTTPACPVAQTFPQSVADAIDQLEWVEKTHVEVVWDPPWTQDRMTEAAKLHLNLL